MGKFTKCRGREKRNKYHEKGIVRGANAESLQPNLKQMTTDMIVRCQMFKYEGMKTKEIVTYIKINTAPWEQRIVKVTHALHQIKYNN